MGCGDRCGEIEQNPLLPHTMEDINRKSGITALPIMRDLVFTNWRTEAPAKNHSCDTRFYNFCGEQESTVSACTLCATPTRKSHGKWDAAEGDVKTVGTWRVTTHGSMCPSND